MEPDNVEDIGTGVTNFSKEVSEFDTGRGFDELNGMYAPKHFFYSALIGPGGCGKTNALLSMLMANDPTVHVYATKIYIFAKDIDEPAYKMLRKVLQNTEDLIKESGKKPADWKYFVMSDNLKDVPQVKDLSKDEINVMVFDDWARDKNQDIIEQHYKMGRKHHCSYYYLSQSYYDVPSFVRKQLTHLFIWKLRNATDINNVLREHSVGFEPKQFKAIYDAITKTDFCFMLIDKKNYRVPIRRGFTQIVNINKTL